jgi:hypothetical protein
MYAIIIHIFNSIAPYILPACYTIHTIFDEVSQHTVAETQLTVANFDKNKHTQWDQGTFGSFLLLATET